MTLTMTDLFCGGAGSSTVVGAPEAYPPHTRPGRWIQA